jgi:hypothetical protein
MSSRRKYIPSRELSQSLGDSSRNNVSKNTAQIYSGYLGTEIVSLSAEGFSIEGYGVDGTDRKIV